VQKRDKYGRLLAYVYLEDGTFVDAWLVEHGFAQIMTVPPNVKYQDLFLKLQRDARGLGGGRWALSFYLLKILVFTRSASNLWFFSCGTSYTR